MSEWYYIWLALGLTWGVFAGYIVLLNRRRAAAEKAIRDTEGGGA
jgi:hypothetical protein